MIMQTGLLIRSAALVALLGLTACGGAINVDFPLVDSDSGMERTQVVNLGFLAGTADFDTASDARLVALNADIIKTPGGLLMVTLGPTADTVAAARRNAFVAKFAPAPVGFTDPGTGLSADGAIVMLRPGPKAKLNCQAAFTPVPGQTLRFIVPDCEVVTALNANVVHKGDLEVGVQPEPGLVVRGGTFGQRPQPQQARRTGRVGRSGAGSLPGQTR